MAIPSPYREIYNGIIHAYIPEEHVPQILNIDQHLYDDYVDERINGSVGLGHL
jgi:hypothetical protein